MDNVHFPADSAGVVPEESSMKEPGNTAKNLLDLPYAPEAEAYLDELERSGQFRIGIEAEQEDTDSGDAASNDYSLERGSGSVSVQDWWTTGRVCLRIGAGIRPEDLVMARVDDSLLLRTVDGLDRIVLDGYLGLIPDASTLRVEFSDGTEWAGEGLRTRLSSWLSSVPARDPTSSS
jgi:hypothetical protein